MVLEIKPLPSVSLKVKCVIYAPLVAPNRPVKIIANKFQTLPICYWTESSKLTSVSHSNKQTVSSSVWCH